ncbi:MAG: PKD domain-containing protein [Bacteroidetes bacterium]|nr:PKD domain-containing protein [Bacteroidota bacterium]
MNKIILIRFCASAILIAFGVPNYHAQNPQAVSLATANPHSLRGSGMSFTLNKGQIADRNGKPCPEVLYKSETPGADIYLRKTGLSYVLSNMNQVMHEIEEQVEEKEKAGEITEQEEKELKEELMRKARIKLHRVDMEFESCNKYIQTINEEELEGYNNYYYGHCPNGVLNVKQYNKVTYKNIYEGIDIAYYGDKQNGIKYDLIVHPHADPDQIKLRWKGADHISINHEGALVIKTGINEFTETLPKVYQNINGKIIDVEARYILHGTTVNFELGTWNTFYPLIIDPWLSYYGGNNYDAGLSVCTDNLGNVIFSGQTYSLNFPISIGASQIALAGSSDAFIVKMTSAGVLSYATYLGGSAGDCGKGVDADGANNIILTGWTYSINFPLLGPGGGAYFQSAKGAQDDAFIVKFTPAGFLTWSTYYGGNSSDVGHAIVADNTSSIIITGYTNSTNFPTMAPYQAAFAGALYDGYIVKFNSVGIRQWATYYGSPNEEEICGVAVDNSNVIFICGYAEANFPILLAHQPGYGGGGDAFAAKLNPATGFPIWSTYYGGSAIEFGSAIAVDASGNCILAGATASATNIATAGAQQIAFAGGPLDAFIVKFNNAGVRQWGTYMGGNSKEWIMGCAIDGKGNIYACGDFEDQDVGNYPISTCAYQTNSGGEPSGILEDQFIAKYDSNGKQKCITYLGGTTEDEIELGPGPIAIYGNDLYITGYTNGGYPVTAGAFQTVYSGSTDAFIDKLCINLCEAKVLGLDYTASNTNLCTNAPVIFTPSVTNSCDTTGYKFQWTFAGGNPASSDSVKPTVTFSGVGTHDVKLVVTTICKKDSITINNYITTTQCTACNLTGQFTKGTTNCTGCGCKEWIMVTATGGTGPYSYSWPDGYTNRYKNQLCPGTYNINIKDKNGCSVNVNLVVP